MPLTIGAIALLGGALLGLSTAAALLLGAALAPTDPVLAGDIGVGPPGDEDEHEPNFALTAEAGLNDGLAAPFVLAGVFIAEQQADWALEWLAADVVYAIGIGVALGAVTGTLAAWSVKRLRSRDFLDPTFDGFHAIATALVIYGARRARRRLRLPRRVRGRDRVPPLRARPRGQRDRARGRRADREAARAGGHPAARVDADGRRAGDARLGGLAARRPAARGRASARVPRLARRLAHGPP